MIRWKIFFVSACLTITLVGCGIIFPAPLAVIDLLFHTGESVTVLQAEGEPFFTQQAIFYAVEGRVGHHAASIIAFEDGELLAAWYAYTGPHELTGSAIFMAERPPGADRWSEPRLHIDRPVGDGNPVLYNRGDKVWLFQAVVPGGWSGASIEFQTSNDRGRTWNQPRKLTGPIGSNTRFPPVQFADGSFLLPAYDDLFLRSIFFASDDGENWRLRSAITSTPGNLQPSIVVLREGRILSVMRNQRKGWLWISASDDQGYTWSAPVDSGIPNPGSPAMLLPLASGNLLLIYNDSDSERRPLSARLSADEGRAWSAGKVLFNDGFGKFSYPSAVQAPDGLIHIVFSHNRDHIHHIAVNESWILSEEAVEQ